MLRSGRAAFLAVLATLAAIPSGGAPFPIQRVTDNDADELATFRRAPVTSRGQILFVTADDTIWLFDGTSPAQPVQTLPAPGDEVESTSFTLGSGAIPGQVIGGWRRGTGYGNVSVDGAAVATIMLNPESVSIRDGCVFMVLQDGTQHAFQIDPTTGARTQLSSGTVDVGAGRIFTSGCKAVWTWQATNADPVDLQFWNGTSTSTLDTNVDSTPSFSGPFIVYSKFVGGVQQVVVVDTTDSSPSPVQLSAETDPTKYLAPQTDGRHVVWRRSNADGSDATLVLSGGLVFPTGPLAAIDAERPFQLDRGQLLWKSGSGAFRYDDGRVTHPIDPSPATTFTNPWLVDGFISFVGQFSGGGSDVDTEVFRITLTAPDDAEQPSPPLHIEAVPGAGEVTVSWDSILGADSYNLYVAEQTGVTKDNYASLAGGMRVVGVTSPHTLSGLASNTSYTFVVTAVEGATEGSGSREVSATLIGSLAWTAASGAPASSWYSAAADSGDAHFVYAGAAGAVYRSVDGGLGWSEALSGATTGGSRIAGLAVDGGNVFANVMSIADIWKSANHGISWTSILEADGFGELQGSLALDPTDGQVIYAGDFQLAGYGTGDSLVIKSIDGGANWVHAPEGPELGDEIHAYAIAVDPNAPATVYAGGSGTPNLARSADGAASWASGQIVGAGQVNSIAVDPRNGNVVWASTRDHGVYRSDDRGVSWVARNGGLTGLAGGEFVTGEGFNSILVDPHDSGYLHLGAGNGYWYSIDGGENWVPANGGFGTTPYIYALALTPARRLVAATDSGLFILSIAGAPVVETIDPDSGDVAGGTDVTISGKNFQPGAGVTIGGSVASSIVFVDRQTLTATTGPHSVGAADVVVSNPGGGSGTLTSGFLYTDGPPDAPEGVSATATSTSSVEITWNASPGAASYQVYRRSAGGEFVEIGAPETTSEARGALGFSTGGFTDSSLSGALVKAAHLQEIRIRVK
ncbi:MAG: IPT/TIG domain-containing protein [Acidobacteria bacterium]|nr:IPT/TIG domain-containing protein [Acidobacteriota bacterium]